MGEVIGFAILMGLAFLLTGAMKLAGVEFHPGEKRTYIFETEDGEQYNPFSDPAGEAETEDQTCSWCGVSVDDEFVYCHNCTRRL